MKPWVIAEIVMTLILIAIASAFGVALVSGTCNDIIRQIIHANV